MAALPVFIILICQHSPGLKPGLFFHFIVIASYEIKKPDRQDAYDALKEDVTVVTARQR